MHRCLFVLFLFFCSIASVAHAGEDKLLRLRSQFQSALQKRDYSAAAETILQIGGLQSPEAARFLLSQMNAGDSQFFDALRKALRGFNDDAVTDIFLQQYKAAKGEREWQKRAVLGHALAGQSGALRAESIQQALNDPNSKVRLGALRGVVAGEAPLKEKIPLLIQALAIAEKNKDRGTPHLEARLALIQLTGHDFDTSGGWENFWKTNGESFDVSKKGDKTATSLLEELAYFGVPVTSRRLLFILDISNSMDAVDYRYYKDHPKRSAGGGGGGGGADGLGGYLSGKEWRDWLEKNPESHRIKLATLELSKLIEKLPEDALFNIILYNNKVTAWKPALVAATAKEKKDAQKFIQFLNPRGASSADLALEEAFKSNAEADTLYFLSDGIPSRDGRAELPVEPILLRISQLNRYAQMTIHGFSVIWAGEKFLKPLAEQNGGQYKLLRDPAKQQ